MAKQHTPEGPTNGEKAMNKLRDAVSAMDCFAQTAFTEIALLTNMALKRLETPDGIANNGDWLGDLLEIIQCRACEAEDDINSVAESVGANHVNTAARRRFDALREAQNRGQQ